MFWCSLKKSSTCDLVTVIDVVEYFLSELETIDLVYFIFIFIFIYFLLFIVNVTNLIQLVSLQPVDRFLQTKLHWKAPNEDYPYICERYKSDNK